MRSGVPQHVIEMLRAVPLFSDSSPAELRSIAQLGTAIAVHEGRVLTTQGRPGSEFFLIVSGRASCTIDGEQVAELGAGDFFGELALLSGEPRSATIVADSEMEVIVFSAREFSTLLADSQPVATQMLGRLADRVSVLEHAAAA